MTRPLLMTAAVTAVLAYSFNAYRHAHRRRLTGRPQALPESLHTWEGEGGGLPEGPSLAAASPSAASSTAPVTVPSAADEEDATQAGTGTDTRPLPH